MKLYPTFVSYALVPLCLIFSSCKDKKSINVYMVSKPTQEAPAAANPSPSMGQMASGSPMGPTMPAMGTSMDQSVPPPLPAQVSGTPPSNWEAQPLSSMRQASYLVKGTNGTTGDISLVVLAGAAGGVLDNVNRWLSQLGQPTITTEQLAKMVRHVTAPLGDVSVVDLEGLPQGSDASKDGRIVAGIASGDNGTFFFKMRGNAPLVESQKEAFIQWIGTVKKGENSQTVVSKQAASPPASAEKKPQIKWFAPKDWKSAPPSAMRYASFTTVGKNGESGDVSVSVFAGEGGGDLANVNRWRSQLGLEALKAEELKSMIVPIACQDGEILSVDMNGAKARVLAGWARIDGKSWFFKLIGPAEVVEVEKAKFEAFLKSVQFHP
ncbi:MAG: hypothetical protein WCP60_06575 [bacterium]